jgi:hypothetical protein
MIIAAVVGVCVLVAIIAFVVPRLSHHAERGGKKPFSLGSRGASKAPGKAGEVAAKPFQKAQEAVGKSGSKGREGRSKAPF